MEGIEKNGRGVLEKKEGLAPILRKVL